MATKTVSIDMDAYERLRSARDFPTESFSKVIKRAHWDGQLTARSLLARAADCPVLDEATLEELERAQSEDAPPGSEWQS